MGAVGSGWMEGFSGGEGMERGVGGMEGEGGAAGGREREGEGGREEGVMYVLYGRFRRQVFEVEFDIVD